MPKLKSQSFLTEFLQFLLLPVLIFLPITLSISLILFVSVFKLRRLKSELGQSQILATLLFAILATTIVIATNSTKTGMFINNVSSLKELTQKAEIQVYANTSISLEFKDSKIFAKLLLDNGSSIPNQELKLYLNDSYLYSNLTDENGLAIFEVNQTGLIKLIFEGNESLFLNPSFQVIEIENRSSINESNRTFNEIRNVNANDTFAPIILNERINSSIAFVNEAIRLSAEVFDDTQVKNVSFVIIKPSRKIIEVFPVNEGNVYYYDLILDEVGNYTFSQVKAFDIFDNFNSTSPNITLEAKETETKPNVTLLPVIEASVFVRNITEGKNEFKLVEVIGNVNLVSSNVKLILKDPNGKVLFEDEKIVSGNFSFSYKFNPKISGKYFAEIYAGNVSKTIEFQILKHVKVKPKIKQEKFNYDLGEKIKFEILPIDEDTGEIYPNAKLKVFVVDPFGNVTEVNYTEIEKGKFVVELDTEREFRPGLYKLKVKLSYVSPNPGEVEVEEEVSFGVGLVVINTPKSIYLLGENATIIVGVLNKEGHRIPDANVTVKVTTPSGNIEEFSTLDKVVSNGDGTYNLSYEPKEVGIYRIYARAIWEDLDSSYETIFEVREKIE
ncbi:MAG: filamin/ABP280 repeat domain-containing protein, partial [Candidatus Aenigmatarchaeota archaeon]